MKKIIHYIGLDVHKESIAAIAREGLSRREPIYSLRFRLHDAVQPKVLPML